MGWYEKIIGYFCKQKIREMNNIPEDYEFKDMTKDFFEGMRSSFDLSGERYFNDFKNYPDNASERIGRCWANVGSHLYNAMDSFAKQNNLPHPSPFNPLFEEK